MLRIALVGLGNMGKLHLKNLLYLQQNKKCVISCVCDIKKELVDEIYNLYGIKGFYNVEDMIEKGNFDIAIIATTSTSHFEIAKLLIEDKKHILIEKPVVLNAKNAVELNSISIKNNILISAGYTEVYNSVTDGIIEFVKKDNEFEYIDFLRIGLKTSKNNNKDIDVIHDLMIHDLSIMYKICNIDNIKNIFGMLSSFNFLSKQYDLATLNVVLNNNKIIRFLADRNGVLKKRKVYLSKVDNFAEFDFMEQTCKITKKGDLNIIGSNIWFTNTYQQAQIRYVNNPLLDEIQDFIEAVEKGRETRTSKDWFKITLFTEKIRDELYKNIKIIGENYEAR
ncbi:Gfo/Idh/MocA family oxidoreductase [Caloramator sp. CAR-1]|uniref:Gfo/Idh/MocA family protein n=1 Tax=Caloramator sp. CAR-1 TaxID=3062777 RepID=UPI0026E17E2D|nr:Gfo/Idh/MocA family oxidoreductase [Caloramator sp. CAR-1]MDO6355390.1 Gfo/Idh/MocA family oxidoreductase [Caloramator sp. CAR-1]